MTTSAEPTLPDTSERQLLRRIGQKVRRQLATNTSVQTIVNGPAEMWAVGRFFDAVECGRLIAMIDARAQPSTAYGVEYSSGLRTSSTTNFDPADPFVRQLQRRLDALLGIAPANGETIQGQRYLPGQEFKPHVDWFTPNTSAWTEAWPRGGQRSFTVMAYLNAVEAGGETDFPLLDLAIEPRPGTLLIWNNADAAGAPNPRVLHAGNPVTRGTKYVITRWYRCGRWW